MDSREKILGKLKVYKVTTSSKRKIVRPDIIKGSLEKFSLKAEQVGANVWITKDINEAQNMLIDILTKLEGNIVYSTDPIINEVNLFKLLRNHARGALEAAIDSVSNYKSSIYTYKVGITGCLYAISDSGSLVMAHSNNNEKLLSMAPEHHICILKKEQILENKYILARIIEEETRLPSAYSIITGVSRNTDIMLPEVRGMHGPKSLDIIVIK